MGYEECVKQAAANTAKCRSSNSSHLNLDKICTDFDQKLKKLCSAHSGKGECELTKIIVALNSSKGI